MNKEQIEKLGRRIQSRIPLFGGMLRRAACRKLAENPSVTTVPYLIEGLRSKDGEVRSTAESALRSLTDPEAVDAVCEEVIHDPTGPAAKLCIRTGKRPADHERACLFLFVTRQLDAYFEEDFEFQNLRLQYDRADPKVRGHVMEVVRSGDRRCAGFFGTRSKPLAECNETEIKLAMDSWNRHREWSQLFQACLELPLKYSLAALKPLSESGWQPDSPELRIVFQQIAADGADEFAAGQKEREESACTFEQWLVQGRTGEMAKMSEAELLDKLKSASPIDGVAIVAALALKGKSGAAAAQAVEKSPRWLVRLAGHATGLCGDLSGTASKDDSYWVRELSSSASVLERWPGKATPADLEALSSAPGEAWVGKLGAARKVLKTILAHRITTGTFEPMVIEAGEFAAEFVEAGEIEFDTGEEE